MEQRNLRTKGRIMEKNSRKAWFIGCTYWWKV